MDNPDRSLTFQLVRNRIKVCGTFEHSERKRSLLLTDGTFIRQGMENVRRFGIPLFATPDQIDPSGEVLTDVWTLESLEECEKGIVKR